MPRKNPRPQARLARARLYARMAEQRRAASQRIVYRQSATIAHGVVDLGRGFSVSALLSRALGRLL